MHTHQVWEGERERPNKSLRGSDMNKKHKADNGCEHSWTVFFFWHKIHHSNTYQFSNTNGVSSNSIQIRHYLELAQTPQV